MAWGRAELWRWGGAEGNGARCCIWRLEDREGASGLSFCGERGARVESACVRALCRIGSRSMQRANSDRASWTHMLAG